jgi:hypothetical protein
VGNRTRPDRSPARGVPLDLPGAATTPIAPYLPRCAATRTISNLIAFSRWSNVRLTAPYPPHTSHSTGYVTRFKAQNLGCRVAARAADRDRNRVDRPRRLQTSGMHRVAGRSRSKAGRQDSTKDSTKDSDSVTYFKSLLRECRPARGEEVRKEEIGDLLDSVRGGDRNE